MIRWAVVLAVLMMAFALFIPDERVTTVMNTMFWTSAFLFAFTLVLSVFGMRMPRA